jgi:hypothetical protein
MGIMHYGMISGMPHRLSRELAGDRFNEKLPLQWNPTPYS